MGNMEKNKIIYIHSSKFIKNEMPSAVDDAAKVMSKHYPRNFLFKKKNITYNEWIIDNLHTIKKNLLKLLCWDPK
ncbi:MAG: hypothetical protein CMD68_01885 [Gammaproteobacteria bacterium]|nr:hypothetical protein [Gammaproteobacteria bacterium]